MDLSGTIASAEKLCGKLTQLYDESHDIKHHRRVVSNVKAIYHSLDGTIDTWVLPDS